MKTLVAHADSWSNSKAAKDLADILNEHFPEHIRWVNKVMVRYYNRMEDLEELKHSRHFFATMLYHDTITYVTTGPNRVTIPKSIETRVRNMITARYRRYCEKPGYTFRVSKESKK